MKIFNVVLCKEEKTSMSARMQLYQMTRTRREEEKILADVEDQAEIDGSTAGVSRGKIPCIDENSPHI